MPDLALDLSLPPPKQTLRVVEDMQAREVHPDIQEIVGVLEEDPITTTHLLRQVNSPVYSLQQRVATIDRAATMLGFEAIANTVFAETFSSRPEEMTTRRARLAYGYLVRTSVAASFIADTLARALKMERHAIVRTAALIHQIGRMALLSSDPGAYLALWKESTSPAGHAIALPPGIGHEIARFRTDYMRHGEDLASGWSLPADLSDSVRHHADPEFGDDIDRTVVLAVAVSQFAARTLYEPAEELDRDQGGERVEKAFTALSHAFDTDRSRLDTIIEKAMRVAYFKAARIEL